LVACILRMAPDTLIHFSSDEFLELELGSADAQLLTKALGLRGLDLKECKVFVNFSREPLTDGEREENFREGERQLRRAVQDRDAQFSAFDQKD